MFSINHFHSRAQAPRRAPKASKEVEEPLQPLPYTQDQLTVPLAQRLPPGTTRYSLVRHGMVDMFSKDVLTLPSRKELPDGELSLDGRFQARMIGKLFGPKKKFARIITSDMQRAVETARIIAAFGSTPEDVQIETHTILREVDPTEHDGRRSCARRAGFDLLAMLKPPRGGDVDEVLVVVHEHVLRGMMLEWYRAPENIPDFMINSGYFNCGLITIVAGRMAIYKVDPSQLAAPWEEGWATDLRGACRLEMGWLCDAQTLANEGIGRWPKESMQVTHRTKSVLREWGVKRPIWEPMLDELGERFSVNDYRQVLAQAGVGETDLVIERLCLNDAEYVSRDDLSVSFIELASRRGKKLSAADKKRSEADSQPAPTGPVSASAIPTNPPLTEAPQSPVRRVFLTTKPNRASACDSPTRPSGPMSQPLSPYRSPQRAAGHAAARILRGPTEIIYP